MSSKQVGIEPGDECLLNVLETAARDRNPVAGWTHNFYRYPARFSPQFAAAAIEVFSKPGDVIFDPYMGGGTTIVEGMAAGRKCIGNDLNSLAEFVTRAKTTFLTSSEVCAVREWMARVPSLSYRIPPELIADQLDVRKTRNLTLVRARFIKKILAAALSRMSELPSANSVQFAKCVLLRCGQWALDGRGRHTTLAEFRVRVVEMADEMLTSSTALNERVLRSGGDATLCNVDAAELSSLPGLFDKKAKLIVTSPPYPGVHVLYHRWQVNGRRESPAPYWISGCEDGQGASYYNFGDRRQKAAERYFQTSLRTLRAIRETIVDHGIMVQLIAFSQPEQQLESYLDNMKRAGFEEVSAFAHARIWRDVPNRKWHASIRGATDSTRELILVHRAT